MPTSTIRFFHTSRLSSLSASRTMCRRCCGRAGDLGGQRLLALEPVEVLSKAAAAGAQIVAFD